MFTFLYGNRKATLNCRHLSKKNLNKRKKEELWKKYFSALECIAKIYNLRIHKINTSCICKSTQFWDLLKAINYNNFFILRITAKFYSQLYNFYVKFINTWTWQFIYIKYKSNTYIHTCQLCARPLCLSKYIKSYLEHLSIYLQIHTYIYMHVHM